MNFELWTLLCFIYAWTSILLGLAFLCMTAFVLFIALQRHVPHSTSFTLCFFVYCVASALLVVGPPLTLSVPRQTLFTSTSSYSNVGG